RESALREGATRKAQGCKKLVLTSRIPYNTPSQEHRAEGGASRKGSDLNMSAAYPKAMSQGVTTLSHEGKKVRKEKWCSKGWRRVSSTDSETRGRAYPRTRTIQGAAAKTERWAMLTWCHMFNSTLTRNARVWFDDLPQESIDSYDDLKKAFLENYLQQKNASNIRSKSTTSSREMGNPWKNSYGGHTIDECMHLKRQIEEMLKAGKLSHLIKELKQSNENDQQRKQKGGNLRKGQVRGNTDGEEDGTEGPMIIKVEMGGHFVHRIYVDEGSSLEILKTMSKENLDSPVYRSRNVKIPSDWQKGYITEEHDYSAIMHNGLRTRSTSACNRSSKKKDSGSNSPRISRTNYNNRLHSKIRRMEGVVRFAKVQP
nr:reverse transcriptase domain-containing protein [Tanacetum cinerariifolium]